MVAPALFTVLAAPAEALRGSATKCSSGSSNLSPCTLTVMVCVACRGQTPFATHRADPLDAMQAPHDRALAAKNTDPVGHTGAYPLSTADEADTLPSAASRAIGEKTPEHLFSFPAALRIVIHRTVVGSCRDAGIRATTSENWLGSEAPLKNLLIVRFVIRHWTGQFSLAVSYWLIGFAVSGLSVGAALSAKYVVENIPYDPVFLFVTSVSAWLFMGCVLIWHLVGTWRSATRSNARRRVVSWANLAKLMLVIGAIQFVAVLATIAVPQTVAMFDIAFNGDSTIPDYHIALSEADSELTIDGGFKYGLARDVEKLLQTTPNVHVIAFKSVGGRIGEAFKLFRIIAERHLDTVTNSYCLSACTVAFAGGSQRWIGPYAKLGFHSGQFVGLTSAQVRASGSVMVDAAVQKNHTPRQFYRRVQAVAPSDMWYPTRDELLQNNIITQAASGAPSTLRIINTSLRAAMEKLNATLPKQLDRVTWLISTKVDGSNFNYIYRIAAGVVNPATRSKFSELMSAQITKSVCTNASMKTDMESGVTYSYDYFEKDAAVPVYRFDISGCAH